MQSLKMQKNGRDTREEIELTRDTYHAKVLDRKKMNTPQQKVAPVGHKILKESRDDEGPDSPTQLFHVIRETRDISD